MAESAANKIHALATDRLPQVYKAWTRVLGPQFHTQIGDEIVEHFSEFLDTLERQAGDAVIELRSEIDSLMKEVERMKKRLKVKTAWTSNEDTPLHVRKLEIEQVLQDYHAQEKKRKVELVDLERAAKALYEDIDEPFQGFMKSHDLPSLEDLQRCRDQIAEKNFIRVQRLKIIRELQKEARVLPNVDPIFHDDNLKPTASNIHILSSGLEAIRDQLVKAKIEKSRATLSNLWRTLGISDQRSQFQGSNDTETLDQLLAELNRCEVLKKEKLAAKLAQLKSEILAHAEQCLMSRDFVDNSIAKTSAEVSEDALKLHEQELRSLKKYFDQNSELIKVYLSREALKAEWIELKEQNKDRFKNRGGALLKEEKVMKKLQQADVALSEAVKRYEALHHEPFKVHGKPIDVDHSARDRQLRRRAISSSDLHLKPFKDIGNLK